MSKLKILVVEDDLFYQTYVNDLLAETGVDIINASDGEAGLALAIAEIPDLIITDIEIPKIQGFVLFKKLREHPDTKGIPVVMMSAKVEKALLDKHSSLSTHAEGYLVKPFNGQVLIDMIREVVGEDFGFLEVAIDPDVEVTDDHNEVAADDGDPEISQFPEEISDKPGRAGELTVLVVDDSKYICDITKDFLEELGARISTANDGETGYKMASELLPDIVLLDVQMPNLNGFVVCEMLRKQEETKNIPIILMSAVVDDESFQRHSKLRYHADAYLQKPFMKSELHELVRRFTALGDSVPSDVERKTGFFVPPEDASELEGADGADLRAADSKVIAELEQAKNQLLEMAEREARLETEMEGVKKEKDQLDAEVFELKKTVEGKESGLQDKLTLVTQRFEESRAEMERLSEENQALQVRLEAVSRDEKGPDEFEELKRKLKNAEDALGARTSEIQALTEKLQEAESNQDLKGQLTELGAKLQEANAVALEMENRNKVLDEELKDLKEREMAEPVSGPDPNRAEELQKQVESLRRDLTAATAAKREIEDQAKSLLEHKDNTDEDTALKQELEKSREEIKELGSRASDAEARVKSLEHTQDQLEKARSELDELRKKLDDQPEDASAELDTVKDQLAAALARTESLEEERDSLAGKVEEFEELRERNVELEETAEKLEKLRDESQKLAANETQARMDLEGMLESQSEEKTQLEAELEITRSQLDGDDEVADRVEKLENRLAAERDLRSSAEDEIEVLKAELGEYAELGDKLASFEKDNRELKAALRDARKRGEQLEREAKARRDSKTEKSTADDLTTAHWDERFSQLEETLGKTVREAQAVLMEQKDRESTLEETVDSLMRSLEEEQTAYRKEREAWSNREGELTDAFEDALRESRRLMGEEAARLYPMHIPRRSRPLEVVTPTSKYGIAAVVALVAIALFAGGYLLKSNSGVSSYQVAVPVPSAAKTSEPQVAASKPPEPWIARSRPEDLYEELWRKNTVQSVSDDMMIQATLHTREELEAAIKYTAAKEGWTRERVQKAMADMIRTYNLSGSYYITVFSKNLKSGYPGYADNFERHIALRDHSGREVRAHLPGELEGSKFITSRVSAAGKEMNPVFLYEVGLTVAFLRKDLVSQPEGLQLILYDIGAVPMRVLTWDMSGMGSLSYYDSLEKVSTDS